MTTGDRADAARGLWLAGGGEPPRGGAARRGVSLGGPVPSEKVYPEIGTGPAAMAWTAGRTSVARPG
jgi:hypothetical protein